jgi:hypothetical protein
MRSFFIISAILLTLASCKKEYTCVCTNTNTGNESRGDVIKAGPLTKKTWETDCKQNNNLSNGGLKDCHLEDA